MISLSPCQVYIKTLVSFPREAHAKNRSHFSPRGIIASFSHMFLHLKLQNVYYVPGALLGVAGTQKLGS